MTGSMLLDLVLLLVLGGYAVSGARQGLVAGALSLAGFLAGAVVGVQVLPRLPFEMPEGVSRALLMLAGVLLLAWLGQLVGLLLGRRLRELVTFTPARVLDAVLGAVASVLVVALVAWFAASVLRAGPSPALSRAVGDSRVVAAIDTAVPRQAGQLVDGLRAAVAAGDFPRVFAGIGAEEILPVDPPDPAVTDPVARAAAAGVVKVTGAAPSCGRGQEGSGFVVAPQRVVTNAHVVAGVPEPAVQVTGTGPRLDARVVVFDPERDLAVLAVPDLGSEPLPLGPELARGDSAVVLGFPLDGPYDAQAARVRQVLTAQGEDIYGDPGVVREVYSLATRVEPGNSGGPVLDADGAVVGVVFARSLDDSGTGYALTLDEAAPVLDAAGSAEPVDVGRCTPG